MDYAEYLQAKNETRVIRDINGQQMLATIEASTTASKAYAVGDYMIANDKIYKVTATIASGGTITVGTNVEEAKVGTELTELNRQISDVTDNIIDLNVNEKNKFNINGATAQTASGVTFTPHFTNGFLDYVEVNGTATARADYNNVTLIEVPAGSYKLSSYNDENGNPVTFTNVLTEYYGGGIDVRVNGETPRTATLNAASKLTLRIQVLSGTTADHIKVYPMMYASNISDNSYVPYGYYESVQAQIDDLKSANSAALLFDAHPKKPYWILHLDCGRKFVTVANIKTLIDNMETAGMNQIQLHFSDDSCFRVGLTDMNFMDEDGTVYDLSPCLGGTESSTSYYDQDDLDEIITYATGKNVSVVPCIDMPGHMGWILNTFSQFRLGTSNSLDITNATAVKFAKAIVNKYTKYFISRGCTIWNFGFDEFSGLSTLYENSQFDKVTSFANNIIDVITNNGMTPRMYQDSIFYKNDYNYLISNKTEVAYYSNNYSGQPAPETMQRMGYETINMSSHLYWVLGNPSYQVNVTPEYINGISNLLTEFVKTPALTGCGAALSIWCDLATTVDVGDGGDSIVTAAIPLIEAFGNAITRTMQAI